MRAAPKRAALALAALLPGVLLAQEGPAHGSRGMVSSAHPRATEAGLRILARGGNAFDAAVAVAASLSVVEPMMSGMGGYGTILVYDARTGRSRFLNASGRIPRAVDSDVFRSPSPGWEENRRGAKAVSTPGNVNAWAALSREHGVLEWRDLFGPAIELAEEGFILDERTAAQVARGFPEFPPHAQAIYGRDGDPLAAGGRLVQADLGRSLRLVAEEGPGAFHGGLLGRAIAAEMEARGGFLSLEDLQENEAEWWEPIAVEYRGHTVLTASPPANSFPALVRLGLMSRFDVVGMGHNSADYLHTFAEVTKHAFWTRLRWAGDPDVAPPPLDRLLSLAYWDRQARDVDPARARPFQPPGAVGEMGENTTHFVVADRWGNVVSATQTLGNLFGARIMAPGTGIWLNNSLAYSTFEPKGNPMDAHAGRRKLSGDVPLFVADEEGRPLVALGTPGGHTIGQTIPQIVMNILDFGMDVQAAIAAPRLAFAEPDVLLVEEGIPADVRDELERRGHHLRLRGGIGNAHGLTIRWGPDGTPEALAGGADPRGAGLARGH